MHWAKRERGLIVRPDLIFNNSLIFKVSDLSQGKQVLRAAVIRNSPVEISG